MATELVSFRLSGKELDWLKSQCQPGESLNLTAKRLLLSVTQQDADASVSTSVDSEIDSKLEELESRIDKRLQQLEQRLKDTENAALENWLVDTLPKLNQAPGYKDKSAKALIKSIENLSNLG